MSEGGVEIGALSGRVELEDRLSPALDSAINRVSAFDDAFGGLGKRMLEYTASFFTAETALKAVEEVAHVTAEALKELVIEGSHAADIETTFDRMTKAAGLFGEEILNHMRAATHGMVSDIDMMRDVNQMLAVGLKLTDENLTKLAEGGFALAKKSGGDVTDALDKMSGAMTRGYVRSLLLLTGKIDLGKAEDAFAAKLDTTTAHLNEQGKQQAIAEEVLRRVAKATAQVGDEQVRIGDTVEQARAALANFNKDLGEEISNSKVVNEGFAAAEDALKAAFGGRQEELVKAIARAVDEAAIATVYLFKYMGEGYEGSKILWAALRKDIEMATEGLDLAAIGVDELAKGYLKLSQITTGADLSFSIHAMDVDIDRLYDNLSKSEKKIEDWTRQQYTAATAAGKWDAALQGIIDRMEAAKKQTEDHDDVQRRLIASFQGGLPAYEAAKKALEGQAIAHSAAAKSAEEHGTAEEKAAYTVKQTAAEAEKLRKATEELKSTGDGWKGTVEAMDQEMVKAIKSYLEAGASQADLATFYGVTATQIRDVAKALQEETKAHNLEIKQMEDSAKRWADYNNLVVQMSGSTEEKIEADIAAWVAAQRKSHVDAKTDTADYYEWEKKMSGELRDQKIHDLLVANEHSKAHFEQLATDAKNAYQFAMEHADQFTQTYIDGLRKSSDEAALAAQNWQHSVGNELDDLTAKAKGLQSVLHDGFSFDVTSQNFADTARQFRLDVNQAWELAKKGYSFQEIVQILGSPSNGPLPPPRGPRIPGFREGGIGDFGDGTLAVLHGREAIVPLDGGSGSRSPLGGPPIVNIHPGAIVLNYPIMDNPQAKLQLRNMLNELFIDSMRNRGQRIY